MNKNVVVIGQGYVGLPLAQAASAAGHQVVGLDLDHNTVVALNAGRSHVDDLSDADIEAMLSQGYTASADETVIASADVVVICVPTPLGEGGSPDLKAVEAATRSAGRSLKRDALVILESTTYPGTTEDVLRPILNETGLVEGNSYYLAFSPERIDPGNPVYGMKNTPKLVGGVSAISTTEAVAFYSTFIDEVIPMAGAREAETAKLLENTYRHINIALVNEMARFCNDLDIDIWDVIRGAGTKPFGFQAFYPGPGVGGHCIPIDPNYLGYQVKRTLGYPFRFVELAQEINSSMPNYVVTRCAELLNEDSRSLRGSRVLLIGVTYKPDIADQRESPATPIANGLLAAGVDLAYFDPFVSEWTAPETALQGEPDLLRACQDADLVVVLQNHQSIDASLLESSGSKIFDCRGTLEGRNVTRL